MIWIDYYYEKPVDMAELVAKIDELVQKV